MRLAAALLFAILPSLSAAQVNKCTINGQIAYQATPCPGEGTTIDTHHLSPAQAAAEKTKQRRAKAISMGFPPATADDIATTTARIGMSAEAAAMAWGKPTRKNATITANGRREQWVYIDGYVTKYLYFENGTLRSIQTPDH